MPNTTTVNAAKYAQRLKHKRHVMSAIRFMEGRRKRIAPIVEKNKKSKEFIVQSLKWKYNHLRVPAEEALKNAREDWELGPLRPNRAIGADKELYGTVDRAQLRRPEVPEHWFDAEAWVQKRMKEKIPENVLFNRYPIVVDDRVVVIRGREANKIGKVKDILTENNTVIVTGLNKAWIDSKLLDRNLPDPKHEFEVPIPYEDVRLVIPDDVYQTVGGRTVKSRQDVIVDAIDMERHTRGIDPFTGQYSYNIPKEHQVDPKTEEVIWHRYVAGTRQAIEWPWEESRQKKLDDARRPGGKAEIKKAHTDLLDPEKKRGVADVLKKANPLTWFRGEEKKEDANAKSVAEQEENTPNYNDYNPENQYRWKPQDRVPDYDDDTPRNLVEISEAEEFIPTLVYPPMPETVAEELGNWKREVEKKEYDEKRAAELREERRRASKLDKERELQKRIESMKTPMQVRWELQQKQKQKHDPIAPQPDSQDLLLALGQHMAAKGVTAEKLEKKKSKLTA
jgi:large subunit ribosomal protein L24